MGLPQILFMKAKTKNNNPFIHIFNTYINYEVGAYD